MKKLVTFLFFIAVAGNMVSFGQESAAQGQSAKKEPAGVGINGSIQNPQQALAELKKGNFRFVSGKLENTNYLSQVQVTKNGQKPHSAILTCMDSRVPPEIIFDQGIGNVFTLRVAGNVEDANVLGSMEYAVEHAGSKLIVVMGHTHCGAVTGAVKDVKIGNLTQLLEQIKPAIKSDPNSPNIVDETAKNNVQITIADILSKSAIIKEMVEAGKVAIVGAFYDIETGVVTFVE